jgi:microcystin-dependent protein
MQYLSELRIFTFNFAPKGWALCNGQLLPISAYQPLFALLGTAFGGDGKTTFGLPNLQARVPMHMGKNVMRGQAGGEAFHQLTVAEMPAHSHIASASSTAPKSNSPAGNFWASNTGFGPYGSRVALPMAPTALLNAGSGVPHENRSPFLVLNVCIALTGVFPPQN